MKDSNRKIASEFIKKRAAELGFFDCGIAKAEYLENEASPLESWLSQGKNASMDYMANHFDLRLDVRKLVPDAKSVIVLLFNYFPSEELMSDGNFKIARYAYGKDYHKVLRKKLKGLLSSIKEQFGEVSGRCFVDSAPVMERVWAKKAGLGWTGKNTLLLSKQKGSYFFLTEVVIDMELEYDHVTTDHCGSCTACIDACPTEALTPYELDSNKCISYLTIELKDSIDEKYSGKMNDWVFGCDICQEVCPWNRFSTPHNEPAFNPSTELQKMDKEKWLDITEDIFESLFIGSAVKRTGYSGLKRNIKLANQVP